MTGPAVTMSPQMNESDSSVGGGSSADPLLSGSEPDLAATEPGGSAGEPGGSPAEPDVEIVDGLPVLAEVRTVERTAPAALPAVQV
ncbi:MAG TPA: hypothetical protein VJU80_10335, partial [Solirubrobacteraceae bacterium]|nr:hypothetical protein [Solirubrobacteraceae bacterium]